MSGEGGKLPRWMVALGGLVALGLAVYGLRNVLSPIFFAFLIAYLLDPLVDRFEDRGVPRALGIVGVLVVALGGMALFLVLILPPVVGEVIAFGRELPDRMHGILSAAEPWLARYGIEAPRDFGELRTVLEDALGGEGGSGEPSTEALARSAASALGAVGSWVWGGTATLLGIVTSLLIVPVLAFYLLYDFDRMTAGIADLIPHRHRAFVVDVAKEVDQVLGQFIRGQLLVMFALAVLYSVAFSIAGIRLAIPIGIVAGLLSFIPYVGGASALILALLMCALGFESWWQVGGVIIGYAFIQGLEGLVITPRIVGDKVGLPAVWVLVALMVGGELFGFLGVLLALPMAAIGKIFVMRALAYYRKSHVYLEGRADEHESALVGILREEGLPDDEELAKQKEEAQEGGAGTEPEPEPDSDSEPEPEPGPDSEPDSEPEPEPEPEPDPTEEE